MTEVLVIDGQNNKISFFVPEAIIGPRCDYTNPKSSKEAILLNLRSDYYQINSDIIGRTFSTLTQWATKTFSNMILGYCLRRIARDLEVRNILTKIENQEECISAAACAAYFNLQIENAMTNTKQDLSHQSYRQNTRIMEYQ